MKNLLNERRGHTIHSLREYAIVLLRFLGIERTDENILIMVDKIIDILVEMKPSDVVFDERGNIHPRTKIPYMGESNMKRKIIITETQLKKVLIYESKEEQEKQEFKKPIFKGISDLNYSSKENKLYVTIDVKNPSRLNLKIKDYDLDILIDGSLVGNTKMEGETIILKKGGKITSIKIPVELDIQSKMVINMVKDYITNSNSDHTIEIKGTLKGGIFIFSKKIKISESMSFKIDDLNGLDKLYDLLTGDAKKTIDDAKKEIEKLYNKAEKEVEKTINKGKNLLNKINIRF